MIKAEVITHEGNPGPNWLDHCRTAITPGRFITMLAVIIIAALALSILHYRAAEPRPIIQTNTQSHPNQSGLLQVQPLKQETSSNAEGLPTVQAPVASSPSTGAATDSSVQGQAQANPVQGRSAASAHRRGPATAPSAPLFAPSHLLESIFQ